MYYFNQHLETKTIVSLLLLVLSNYFWGVFAVDTPALHRAASAPAVILDSAPLSNCSYLVLSAELNQWREPISHSIFLLTLFRNGSSDASSLLLENIKLRPIRGYHFKAKLTRPASERERPYYFLSDANRGEAYFVDFDGWLWYINGTAAVSRIQTSSPIPSNEISLASVSPAAILDKYLLICGNYSSWSLNRAEIRTAAQAENPVQLRLLSILPPGRYDKKPQIHPCPSENNTLPDCALVVDGSNGYFYLSNGTSIYGETNITLRADRFRVIPIPRGSAQREDGRRPLFLLLLDGSDTFKYYIFNEAPFYDVFYPFTFAANPLAVAKFFVFVFDELRISWRVVVNDYPVENAIVDQIPVFVNLDYMVLAGPGGDLFDTFFVMQSNATVSHMAHITIFFNLTVDVQQFFFAAPVRALAAVPVADGFILMCPSTNNSAATCVSEVCLYNISDNTVRSLLNSGGVPESLPAKTEPLPQAAFPPLYPNLSQATLAYSHLAYDSSFNALLYTTAENLPSQQQSSLCDATGFPAADCGFCYALDNSTRECVPVNGRDCGSICRPLSSFCVDGECRCDSPPQFPCLPCYRRTTIGKCTPLPDNTSCVSHCGNSAACLRGACLCPAVPPPPAPVASPADPLYDAPLFCPSPCASLVADRCTPLPSNTSCESPESMRFPSHCFRCDGRGNCIRTNDISGCADNAASSAATLAGIVVGSSFGVVIVLASVAALLYQYVFKRRHITTIPPPSPKRHSKSRHFDPFVDAAGTVCCICYSAPPNVACQPCGHVFCRACVLRLNNTCAICRSHFAHTLQLVNVARPNISKSLPLHSGLGKCSLCKKGAILTSARRRCGHLLCADCAQLASTTERRCSECRKKSSRVVTIHWTATDDTTEANDEQEADDDNSESSSSSPFVSSSDGESESNSATFLISNSDDASESSGSV
eukprot:TRINITY_DN13498_c0_g1_i1.p1 TRINITY_DN13498_c0_g1~~TRINITY_DN13498_c0_g1_i1.p1  ORF type:complete len:936 (-),score=51.14 TRINITY_DN13498_c0_g1_i1:188-2995(-)